MKYILFVLGNPGAKASDTEMQDIDAFNDKLQANGNWIMAAGIEPYQDVSGFWIIQADSDEEAEALAREGSIACNRNVAVRPFLGNRRG